MIINSRSGCPSEFVLIANKCYSFQQQAVPWLEAKSSCESDGGVLASIQGSSGCLRLSKMENGFWSGSCTLTKRFICERDYQLTVDAEVATLNRDQSRKYPRKGRLSYP
ncbi:hypothetical protein Avbf_13672 [Armadillidium vulgare]|nr:hypothetical protein Avbf_13672 [Armadillidium vulgare]